MWSAPSGSFAESITWALVHFLWQGAALAAGLALFLSSSLARTAQARYAASVLTLAGMAAAVVATVLLVSRPDASPAGSAGWNTPAQQALDGLPVAPPSDTQGAEQEVYAPLHGLQPYVLSAWFLGVGLLSVRLAVGYLAALALGRDRIDMPAAMVRAAEQLARQLGIPAKQRVFASRRVSEALVVGFVRPVVLVPLAWLTELPPDVLEAVIAHELAHVRRWDRWVVLVQRAVETLLFYHPAVWWVSRTISFQREVCCDEMAVGLTGQRLVYAQALETVGRRCANKRAVVFATSFQGEPEMRLLSRVRNVLGAAPARESGFAWPAVLLSLALAMGAALWWLPNVLAAEGEREGDRPAAAREREGAKQDSPEARADRRRSPEADAPRRRPAEGERGVERRRPEEPRGPSPLDAFQPQTDREEALYRMIRILQQEVAQLRREVGQLRGARGGDFPRPPMRDGERRDFGRPPMRDGEGPRPGPRDGEGPRPGPRDGEGPRPGPRDDDAAKRGPRDGEGPARPHLRDNDIPPRRGPRDGEGPRPALRDGEGPARPGPREGDAPARPRAEDN